MNVSGDPVGTRFVSGYRAYERLPEDLRHRIEGMKAIHVRERVFDRPIRRTSQRRHAGREVSNGLSCFDSSVEL